MPDAPSILTSPPVDDSDDTKRGVLVNPAPPYRTPGANESPPPVTPARPIERARPAEQTRPADEVHAAAFEAGIGDSGGEHLMIDRGRYSAWFYVVIAFIGEIMLLAALPTIALRYVLHPFTSDTSFANGGGVVVGAVLAWWVFRDRWRCIEASASKYCSGLMNLSMLYVPIVAMVDANLRGLAKLTRRR